MISRHMKRQMLPLLWLDGLWDFIEVPLLLKVLSVLSKSHKIDIVWIGSYDSFHWHSGLQEEWSVDFHSEILVHSLLFVSLSVRSV
jgi:hypothetical protein